MADENNSKRDRRIVGIGLVASAFASILTLATLNPLDKDALTAANAFAVGIPLAGTGFFLGTLPSEMPTGRLREYIRILSVCIYGFGQLGCVIGIYFLFRHLSEHAGKLFITTIVVGFLVQLAIFVIVRIDQGKSPRQALRDTLNEVSFDSPDEKHHDEK